MSESGNEGAREAERKAAERERHEKTVSEVMETLRAADFLRPGEYLKLLPPEEGAKECVVCCETTILGDKKSVAERTERFGAGDPLSDALEAAGYRVVVDYDQEKSDATFDCLRYSLYEKEKLGAE